MVFGRNKAEKREDDDTFAQRIRTVIEESTCATSGIKVFEHEDESALNDHEQEILSTLRKAHEEWRAKNGDK